MDRAIVEILNAFALIFLVTVILFSTFTIYNNMQSINSLIMLKNLKSKIENILEEIYFYSIYYNTSIKIELLTTALIYIQTLNYSLLIVYLGNQQAIIKSPLHIQGGGFGYDFIFQYNNNSIFVVAT